MRAHRIQPLRVRRPIFQGTLAIRVPALRVDAHRPCLCDTHQTAIEVSGASGRRRLEQVGPLFFVWPDGRNSIFHFG